MSVSKHFPFTSKLQPEVAAQPRLGLNPLLLREWIEIDERWAEFTALKSQLLRDERENVFRVLPEAFESCFELRETVAEHLAEFFPDRFQFSNPELIVGGQRFLAPGSAEEALEQVSLWTQEDWALLSAAPPVHFEAGSICFPSRWSLAEKIGKSSDLIHGPVPAFATIAKPTASFLERITMERPVWRLNWSIHNSDQLYSPAHQKRVESALTPSNVLEGTWLRIERQTLRRLPRTSAVVFSIRTYLHRMSEVASDDEQRQLALETIQALPPEALAYKGMAPFAGALLEALRSYDGKKLNAQENAQENA